eukprot:TRINITY_DN7424_c0_g1_i1.p1 TRINITY_DN7424_c0_g1~~TRINITY_DN7424_c0_g1_i1.p1  ORF type:complete len:281 (-),score=41.63 TRINITY_DN7424_c0_g1_i1:335-1177(-)
MAATSTLPGLTLHSVQSSWHADRKQLSNTDSFLTPQQRQGVQVRCPPSCSYTTPPSKSRNVAASAVASETSPRPRGKKVQKEGGNFLSLDMNVDRPLTEEERQQERRKEVSRKIKQLGRNGQASAAVQEMVVMMEEGIMPDRVAATSLVQACIEAGDTKRAESIFDRFFGKDGALIADNVAMGTLLRTYAANKPPRWPKIMALVASMETEYRIKPTAGIYNILLGVCAVTNDTERAVDLMQKMESEDIGPDMLTYEAIRRRRVLRNQYRTVFARFLDDEG